MICSIGINFANPLTHELKIFIIPHHKCTAAICTQVVKEFTLTLHNTLDSSKAFQMCFSHVSDYSEGRSCVDAIAFNFSEMIGSHFNNSNLSVFFYFQNG